MVGNNVCATRLTRRQELLLELAEFLSQRYPTVYSVTRRTGTEGSWFDEPNEICAIEIPDLGVKYDFDSMDAMEIAGMITPTDLAVMMEGEDSMYYMRAGFIALAGSWRFEDKSGCAGAAPLCTDDSREGPVLHSHDGACAGIQDQAGLANDAVFPEAETGDAGMEEQCVNLPAKIEQYKR